MSNLTRRSLLAGLAAVGTASTLASAGCSTPTAPPKSTVVGNAALPTFVESTTVAADLISGHPGGMAGFFQYPQNPVAAFDAPPLSGGTVRALSFTFDPVAPPMAENALWQGLNESLGCTLDVEYAPSGDYKQRFATTIAGGDLPDVMTVFGAVPQLPSLLHSQCTDLTEHLAGDAVTDYPNLAALPTDSWRACLIDGALWGVPISRPPIGSITFARKDIIESRGLPLQPKNYDEFTELLTGLTDPRRNRWATGQMDTVVSVLASSLGVANAWSEDGGKFTANIERPEYEQAIADTIKLVEAGVFHPDGIASTNNQRNDWFTNGVAPIVMAGYVGWPKFEMWGANVDGFELGAILPFGHDSGMEPAHAQGAVTSSFTVVPKTEPARAAELLRVLDWLAAPFGSKEYLLRYFGVEGKTYSLSGTDPVLNSAGQNQRLVPFKFVSDAPQVIYDPGLQRVTEARFAYQEAALPMIKPEPTLGLYSETASGKTSNLNAMIADVRLQILQGRKPLSTWAEAVQQWRTDGGDAIRSEYEAAFAKAK